MLTEQWRQAVESTVRPTFDRHEEGIRLYVPTTSVIQIEAYNFDKQSLKPMESFFTHQYNRVKLGNTTSLWKHVDRGYPQGSSFGPLLWKIYQNDLTYVAKSSISM